MFINVALIALLVAISQALPDIVGDALTGSEDENDDQVLQQLQSISDLQAKHCEDYLNDQVNKTVTSSTTVTTQIIVQLQAIVKIHTGKVTKVKEKAKTAEVDITICLKDEGSILEITNKAVKDIGKCVDGLLGLLNGILQAVLKLVKGIIIDVEKLLGVKKGCTGLLSCLLDLVKNLLRSLSSLLNKLFGGVSDAVCSITSHHSSVGTCATGILVKTLTIIDEIVEGILTCANKKIH